MAVNFGTVRPQLLCASVALFVALLNPFLMHSQVESGTIVGTIKDTSGATVVDANVTVLNTQTDIARQVKTNRDGEYVGLGERKHLEPSPSRCRTC